MTKKYLEKIILGGYLYASIIMARQATDLPRSVAFDHGRLTSLPVSYGILNKFCCVKLRCVTVFDGVHPVLLRMSCMLRLSRCVEFMNIKWHIMGTSSFILEQSL